MLINKETGRLARSDEYNAFRESFVEGILPGAEVADDSTQASDEAGLVEDDYYDNL